MNKELNLGFDATFDSDLIPKPSIFDLEIPPSVPSLIPEFKKGIEIHDDPVVKLEFKKELMGEEYHGKISVDLPFDTNLSLGITPNYSDLTDFKKYSGAIGLEIPID